MKLTSGRRYTWIRGGTFYVNPDYRRFRNSITKGGWHEIVHFISHFAAGRLYNEAHGPRHAWIEKQLIMHVVNSGWLDGKLKRKPKAPKAEVSPLAKIELKIKRWQTKQKRAATALRKLERQRKYYTRYERQVA